jgi:hypothetical protein
MRCPRNRLKLLFVRAWAAKVRSGPRGPQVVAKGRCPVAAIRRIGAQGGSQAVSGMAARTLYDVSARLRFGRCELKSGRVHRPRPKAST